MLTCCYCAVKFWNLLHSITFYRRLLQVFMIFVKKKSTVKSYIVKKLWSFNNKKFKTFIKRNLRENSIFCFLQKLGNCMLVPIVKISSLIKLLKLNCNQKEIFDNAPIEKSRRINYVSFHVLYACTIFQQIRGNI